MRIGSRDELETFLAARQDALVRFGYVLTGNAEAAEDLTQTALVAIFRRWRTVNASGAEAYTRRAMTRLAWRRAASHREAAQLGEFEQASQAQADHDVVLDIRAAVDRLSPDKRTVVVLRFWLGYTDVEIANAIGCSVGTVKSRGHRAIGDLRSWLAYEDHVTTKFTTDPAARNPLTKRRNR